MLMKMKRSMKNAGKALRGEKGFTLIELLIVIAIIGILATMALPGLLSKRSEAEVAATQSDLRSAATDYAAKAMDNDLASFNATRYGVNVTTAFDATNGTFQLSKNNLTIDETGKIQ